MENRKELKILLLKDILKKKNDLFGAFTPNRTKETKAEAWKEVHASAQALQLVPADKNYVYTRDVLWQNIKKASVKKRDNGRQTGSAGGPSAKINTVDELVYLIIGQDSPVLDGMEIPESNILAEPEPSLIETERSRATTDNDNMVTNNLRNMNKYPATSLKQIQKPKVKKQALSTLKEEKMKLMIEYLKVKIEKTKKEILLLDKQTKNQVNEIELEVPSASTPPSVPSASVPSAYSVDEPIYEDAEYLDSD